MHAGMVPQSQSRSRSLTPDEGGTATQALRTPSPALSSSTRPRAQQPVVSQPAASVPATAAPTPPALAHLGEAPSASAVASAQYAHSQGLRPMDPGTVSAPRSPGGYHSRHAPPAARPPCEGLVLCAELHMCPGCCPEQRASVAGTALRGWVLSSRLKQGGRQLRQCSSHLVHPGTRLSSPSPWCTTRVPQLLPAARLPEEPT